MEKMAKTFAGAYRASKALIIYKEAGTGTDTASVLDAGSEVLCDGRYVMHDGIRYLHVTAVVNGATVEGYCQVRSLAKAA